MNGGPAAGMAVALYTTEGDQATPIKSLVLNHDGRTDAPLFDNNSLRTGTYRLTFDVAAYFKARGVQLPEPNFLNKVSLDSGVASPPVSAANTLVVVSRSGTVYGFRPD